MMEDPAQVLFTELPVPLLSTAALLRHHHHTATRFQPYHRLHQPQHFHTAVHEYRHPLQRAFEDDAAQVTDVDYGKTHISCLYPEILAIIFGHLDVRDKGRAAQVCTSWRDAAYRKSVWRGVEAKLHLRKANPSLFASLVKRGIKRVQVLSLRRSLRDVIQGIPNLESLNLSGCYNVGDIGISHAFTAQTPSITELNLSLCKQVTDTSLSKIAQHLKNVEVLELGGCCNITNTGLVMIAWGLKKLKRLNLRSCWHISDQGIGHLAFGNLSLEYLGLQDCQRLSDEALKHATGLTSLKSINLSFCISITDSGLKHLAKMSSLRELNLRSCDNISDIGMAYLAEGGSRVSSLDVSFCDKIGDQALVHISQGLFNLKSLSLSACQISDEGLAKIANTIHDLETLNIGQCSRVTDKGLAIVAESLTRLKCIDLYGCTRITTAGLEKIMKLPQLGVLNLGLWHVR
ncbi:F-box/LRR-repeat protein 14 [Cylas formicarius]|uniref:F-box/LRR-repeat protein 14 n=1 Tax=Cylas formicarius TaxID=197179 RepID=UPI002958CBD0|nr:F-box/LRR-repeat protein 14 [Cylas formicarius]